MSYLMISHDVFLFSCSTHAKHLSIAADTPPPSSFLLRGWCIPTPSEGQDPLLISLQVTLARITPRSYPAPLYPLFLLLLLTHHHLFVSWCHLLWSADGRFRRGKFSRMPLGFGIQDWALVPLYPLHVPCHRKGDFAHPHHNSVYF